MAYQIFRNARTSGILWFLFQTNNTCPNRLTNKCCKYFKHQRRSSSRLSIAIFRGWFICSWSIVDYKICLELTPYPGDISTKFSKLCLFSEIRKYYSSALFILCLSGSLSICLYPIKIKTAESIGPKLFVGPHMTQRFMDDQNFKIKPPTNIDFYKNFFFTKKEKMFTIEPAGKL